MSSVDLDAELAAIAQMDWATLQRRWAQVTGAPPPRVRHALLRMALAFELQAAVYGGLSRRTTDRLSDMTAASHDNPRTTTLVREWKGTLHTVLIGENQAIHWNGKQWGSLSEVARAITGTRWSGPAFFGLKKRSAA